jgi:hypothetical protein
MIIDEIFHDGGYGHYLDLDTDQLIIDNFYKVNVASTPIDIVNKNCPPLENDDIVNKSHIKTTFIIHLNLLSAISYLSYSLLFKKL